MSAQLYNPSRVTLTANGDFYISDWGNHRVRRVAGLGSPNAPTLSSTSPGFAVALEQRAGDRQRAGGLHGHALHQLHVHLRRGRNRHRGAAGSPGLAVSVADDSTTTFWAKTTDSGGSVSGCSTSSLTYVEDSTPPNVPSIDSAPPSPGQRRDAHLVLQRRRLPELRVPPRARRHGRLRLGLLLGPRRPTTCLPSPTAPTPSRCAARDAAGNSGSAASASYQLDTAHPRRPRSRSAPPTPGNDSSPSWALLGRGRRGPRVPPRARRHGGVRLGGLLEPEDLRPLRPSPTATTPSRCAPPTPPATPARRPPRATTSTAARPAAPSIDSAPAVAGQRRDAQPGRSPGEAGAAFECRLARGATVVSDWAACSDPKTYDLSARARRRPTPSRCAPRDAAGNTGPRPPRATSSTPPPPAAPSIDSAPAIARQRRDARVVLLRRGGRRVRVPPRARRATVVGDWAACSDPKTYDLSAEPDGELHVLGARTRRAPATPARPRSSTLRRSTRPRPPRRRSTRRRRRRATTPRRPGRFSGEAGAAFECRLERGATVVSDWAACSEPEDLRPLRRARRRLHLPRARHRRRRQHRPRGKLDLRPRHASLPAAPSIDLGPAVAGQRPHARAGHSPARRGRHSSAAWCAAPRWSPTGRPARTRRATTSPPSPTASTPSRCARATPRATPARRGQLDLRARHDRPGGARRSTRRPPRRATTPRPPGRSPARPARRSSAGWRAAPPWSRTGRPARTRRLTTSRPSPTATTPSPCARPTPRATPAPAASSSYDLDTDRPGAARRSTRRRPRRATASTPELVLLRRGGRHVRVPPGARRHGGLRLGLLLEPAAPTTSLRARRHLHLLGPRHATPPATPARRPARATSSTRGARRARDRLGACRRPATTRRRLDLLGRGRRHVRVPPGCAAPRRSSDWAACSDPQTYDLSARARRQLHLLGPRPRRRRQHRPRGQLDLRRSTRHRSGRPVDRPRPGLARQRHRHPTWAFSGEAGAAFECRLERGATRDL